ncbi:MAG: hypothetical protein SAK29_07275 [Scytonema sp. PMC 1069.18]|nr:hypothetical protein [Scytonema sp. PMC 1069.18]
MSLTGRDKQNEPYLLGMFGEFYLNLGILNPENFITSHIDFMDTSLISFEAADLLSRITGQKLNRRDLTPLVIFLANLVMVLLGVMFVDGTVAEEEKQRLLTTLYRFSNPESDIRRLTHLMIKGIKENES